MAQYSDSHSNVAKSNNGFISLGDIKNKGIFQDTSKTFQSSIMKMSPVAGEQQFFKVDESGKQHDANFGKSIDPVILQNIQLNPSVPVVQSGSSTSFSSGEKKNYSNFEYASLNSL